MVFTSLADAVRYGALSPRFLLALRYCRETDFTSLPNGRYPVHGEDVFALLQENETRWGDAGRWEAHRRYADIQLVLTGTECMGVAPLEQCQPDGPFDPAADVGFYRVARPPTHRLTVPAGYLAIFFPEDVHMPLLAAERPMKVRKVVVKVRV